MEFSLSSDVLTLVSDKKNIILRATSLLEVDGMMIELPGEYEKSGFLIQSRYLRTPFDPIALAHKELQKQIKQKQVEELGWNELDESDSEEALVNRPDNEKLDDQSLEASTSAVEEEGPISTALIHSLNIEGYNLLLLTGDIPLKALKDEHFSSFIKKVDLIATDGGEGSLDLIRLVEPRITLVYGPRAEGVLTKLGKSVESITKWKTRESDFQSDEGVVIALME